MVGAKRPEGAHIMPSLDWESLLHRTILYAAGQVRKLRWRGAFDGLLPDGFDANAIAAEAFLEVFGNWKHDWLRHPLASNSDQLRAELRRSVRRVINRLHHRKENLLLRNAEDLAPVTLDDDETISRIETIADPRPNPADNAIIQENETKFEAFKHAFELYLGPERRLKNLFECLADGVTSPKAIAAHRKTRSRGLQALQRKLQRRMVEFLKAKSSELVPITARKTHTHLLLNQPLIETPKKSLRKMTKF